MEFQYLSIVSSKSRLNSQNTFSNIKPRLQILLNEYYLQATAHARQNDSH